MTAPRPPVTVLTGFLGAGKTTLLNRLVRDPALARAAVLVNEVGAIAIDHHLIGEVRGDVRILASGCVCCTVGGDLLRALVELHAQVEAGALAPFERVVLETTGLADPIGVLATLAQHPRLARSYQPGAVVTVVDAADGAATLARHREARAQVALADRIALSKRDLADADAATATEAAVRELNPGAPLLDAATADATALIDVAATDDAVALARWLRGATARPLLAAPTPIHADVVTATACFDAPLRLGPLALWLTLITGLHGGQLLRVKGLVAVEGQATPSVVHAVGHVVYPPRALAAWPDDDHRTRLVFIARGMSAAMLRSLVDNLADTLNQSQSKGPTRTA